MFGVTKCVLLLSAALAVSGYNLGDTDVVYHLYTRSNPEMSQPLYASVASIITSSFSIGRRTVCTVHGHGESVAGNFNAFVVNAHLSAEDVNVVAVDWSAGSAMYSQGLASAPQAGRMLASFLNILYNSFGYSPANVRIVGVGLGGHLAGIAARHTALPVPHIVAIDPSLHGWSHHPEALSPAAAALVEVLHASELGYDQPRGHVDFYPNGGRTQPGCGSDASCSQVLGYAFYAESLTAPLTGGNNFVGTACDSYEQATALQCTGPNNVNFGGVEVKTGVSGIYTFLTNMVPPFARG